MFDSKRNVMPEFDPLVERLATALRDGDRAATSALLEPGAIEACAAVFDALAAKRPFADTEVAARARIGHQYLTKLRFSGTSGDTFLIARWRRAGNAWRVCEVEDTSGTATPWSDIPPLRSPRMEN